MNNKKKSISRKIAEYARTLDYNDLSPEVIHEAKRRVLDSFACALGAFTSIPGQIARNMGQRVQSDYSATIFGNDVRTTPELATFANGILFRYLDYNDTYLSKEPAHPSDNIPAAIAVAEAEGGSGRDLITAIVLGYEIQCRFCDSASLRSRGWDHVGYVSISSSVLASRLMNMELEEIEHALALSIAPNIPLRQTRVGELSMWKGCAAANAARNGVFAALLARGGMMGPCEIFEGEKGFFKQVTGPFDLEVEDFGSKRDNFKILDTYIKYYPSEYHSQAGVTAALSLRDKVDIEDIEDINIETYDACVDIIAGDKEKWTPKTRETADHSLPYCVAVALCDGMVGLGQFTEERIKDPDLQKIMSKIKVMRNPEHNKQYPEAFPCFIEIKSKSGETFTKTVTYPKGHPKNALTDSELEEKFNTLNSGLIKDNTLNEIVDNIWNLENLENIGDLMTQIKI
ncbi:MAG: 2-methylcitrate dehydratase [Candidatus Scalindua rubra]|uniref:2-methylcitrate dehydratase n=1 Tax=Candidatus Scalindua rubra TaxID=1872076 RepID=A0A1E3X8G4_9BACT|nr:MAG: 2-methylcitrate dehydratase [Candidatus Scalindua rubra]